MYNPKNLLAVSADTKTIKGEKLGILTGILYLAPHNISGFQVCPKASEGCKAACLYTAGRGIYQKIQLSRINKTKLFFLDRARFMDIIVKDIERLIRKSTRTKMSPCIRLNGTSDIAWEKIKCLRNGIVYKNLMAMFPDVQFYDYTAILNRKTALKINNYHLTFSLKEDNAKDAMQALQDGFNLSVVFSNKIKPTHFWGYPVIDGDISDIRFLDKRNHVIGLSAKGAAKKDTSGFVQKLDNNFIPFTIKYN